VIARETGTTPRRASTLSHLVDLETQISLMTNPQEFTRLCNAILSAEHNDDFLPIDDDRPDRGNDGYLKSQKRIFAAHCFKRADKQSIDAAIRSKMLGDLGKAIALKREGIWDIEAWTFLSNYPVSDAIAERVVKVGQEAGIDVSWRGPPFLASAVREHGLQESFPDLHVTQIDTQLTAIKDLLESATLGTEEQVAEVPEGPFGIPVTQDEQRVLLLRRPPGWEYLLYAGVLQQGLEELAVKWHDEELGMPRGERLSIEEGALSYLRTEVSRLEALVESVMRVFEPEARERAFGAPGEPGDPVRIENLARHVIRIYEAMLDWAAGLRAVVPPEPYERAFEITASMAHQPILEVRDFVDDVVREMGRIPGYLAGDQEEPLEIHVQLELSIDWEVVAAFGAEMARIGLG
jgi:hypothetical protein